MAYVKARKDTYFVRCPLCRALEGQPCNQIKNPKKWIGTHALRIKSAAQAQGWFELSDGSISNHDAPPGERFPHYGKGKWKEIPLKE